VILGGPFAVCPSSLGISSRACFNVTLGGIVTPWANFSYDYYLGMDAVNAACLAGFDTGARDGPGIQSSAASDDVNDLTAVGYIDNALAGPGIRLYNTWRGIDVAGIVGEQVLISYTYYGDANLDGAVDANDSAIFNASLRSPPARLHLSRFRPPVLFLRSTSLAQRPEQPQALQGHHCPHELADPSCQTRKTRTDPTARLESHSVGSKSTKSIVREQVGCILWLA
jgi:hypothetical protein